MSRFDDYDYEEQYPNAGEMWQANARRALKGKRGRKALAEMRQFCEDTEWECQACGEGPEPHGCPMPITVTILDSPAERAIRAQLEAK